MFLGRYQALKINLGTMLAMLALPISSQFCLALESDSALGGKPARVDLVLPYAAVDSLTLPPIPVSIEAVQTQKTLEASTRSSKATISPPTKLNWQPPNIGNLDLDNRQVTKADEPALAKPNLTSPSKAETLEPSEAAPVKVAARPKAPSEPRRLEFAPSLTAPASSVLLADTAKADTAKQVDDDITPIMEAEEPTPEAASDKAPSDEIAEPLLLQPKSLASEEENKLEELEVVPELKSPQLDSPQLRAIDDTKSVDISQNEVVLDGNLTEEELLEEESQVVIEDKPKHEARIAPKSGVTVRDEPLQPLSRGMMNLRSRMRTVLSYYYNQPLNNYENDPWEVMHSMLSYELHSRVLKGGERGKPITAIGHLCFNHPTARKQMMYLNENGDLDVRVGVGLQGHKGQFLAMLAQCNVSPDYPIRVEGKHFTIRDLVEAEQRSCYSKTELTFKLIGLGHYLASDASWLNDRGEVWDIPRLIEEERTQKIRGAACGGTHRLSGLSLAYRRREARDEPLDGEYLEAAKFVSQYQSYAFKLQNSDGSLSTEWFRGRGDEEDIERRIRTTGHLLEWLAYSLPDEQLTAKPTVRAVSYLTNLMATYSKQDWHKGSLAHALHALVVYDKRVFQPHDEANQLNIAVNPAANRYRGYSIYRGVLRGQEAPSESGGFFGLFGGGTRSTQKPSYGRTR